GMPTIALPGLSGIRLALPDPRKIASRIAAIAPDAIHIATEGPISLAVRWYCARRGRPFTTSFHARFADYVAARWRIPEQLSWARPGEGFLGWVALFPQCGLRHVGRDRLARRRADGARIQERAALATRRRRAPVSSAPRRKPRPPAPGLPHRGPAVAEEEPRRV